MMKKSKKKSDAGILLQKAEELLKKKSSKNISQFSEAEKLRLIHELEVHKVELEMQNEELLKAKNQVEVDITEQKLSEKTLAQSNDLLVNLARLVPGVIYQYRLFPDGRSAFPYSSPGIILVLMDIKMPEVNGLEAIRQIKLINQDVPIIAITAYAMSGDEERILAAGCNGYLSKPITKKSLLEKIAEFI